MHVNISSLIFLWFDYDVFYTSLTGTNARFNRLCWDKTTTFDFEAKSSHELDWIFCIPSFELQVWFGFVLNYFFRNGDSHWPQMYFFPEFLFQVYVFDINNQCMQFIMLSLFYFLFPPFFICNWQLCVSLRHEFLEVIFSFYSGSKAVDSGDIKFNIKLAMILKD